MTDPLQISTVPPPRENIKSIVASALRSIANDLDAIRDRAVNGNATLIASVGEAKANIEALRSELYDLERANTRRHREVMGSLQDLLAEVRGERLEFEAFRATVSQQIDELKRRTANGHV